MKKAFEHFIKTESATWDERADQVTREFLKDGHLPLPDHVKRLEHADIDASDIDLIAYTMEEEENE